MIFRDIRTGALLNIRRDEYNNDQSYFREIIRIASANANTSASANASAYNVMPYYSTPYDEFISEQPQKQTRR
jgi:hypothetical protein